MAWWCTKEDLMRDLAVTNGVDFQDYDSYIISGNRPPPPLRLNEDDEYEERFGKYGGVYQESVAPDLNGITAMLRQVNEDEPPRIEIRAKSPELNSAIVISKLNPNVPEFEPKRGINSDNNSANSSLLVTNGKAEDTSTVLKEETVIKNETDTNDSININRTKHDALKPCENENYDLNDDDGLQTKKDLEALLKGKIIEGAKAKTSKEKTARNVAISALLKLKSGPPPSPKKSSTNSSSESKLSSSDTPPSRASNSSGLPKQTIELRPPTFYEQKCATQNPENELSMPQSSGPESNEESNKPVDEEEANTGNLHTAARTVELEDREKIESVKKVEDWLDNTKESEPVAPHPFSKITFKRRDPAPHAGPFEYKKKGSIKSPVSDISRSPQPSEPKTKPSQPPAFVPSQYASELARKFEERAKAKETAQLDVWSKLYKDLEARDEAARQRMQQASAGSDASPSTSTSSNHQ